MNKHHNRPAGTLTFFELLESRLLRSADAVLTHDYEFKGNLNDQLGGPALVSNGGQIAQGSYAFAAGQGLDLTGAVDATSYSIEMDYQFNANAPATPVRAMAFQGLAVDGGLYEGSGQIAFIDSTGAAQLSNPGVVANGTPKQVILTRDGTDNRFDCYVNGVKVITFPDTHLDTQPVKVGQQTLVNFFRDNTSGANPNENGPGVVTRIRVYQNPLTQDQVTFLHKGGDPAAFSRIALINGILGVVGGAGDDTISITQSGSNLVAAVDSYSNSYAAANVSRYAIDALAGNDRVNVGTGVPGGTIFGGDGNDTLVGGDAADVIYGNAGKDKIIGGSGNDVLRGNGGNDQMYGGAGADRIYGYDGADYLDGGSSGDRIFAGDGADTCLGQSGNDFIFTAGDSTIDSVFGGTGTDSVQKDSIDVVVSAETVLP